LDFYFDLPGRFHLVAFAFPSFSTLVLDLEQQDEVHAACIKDIELAG
jgi:hypothetical protein